MPGSFSGSQGNDTNDSVVIENKANNVNNGFEHKTAISSNDAHNANNNSNNSSSVPESDTNVFEIAVIGSGITGLSAMDHLYTKLVQDIEPNNFNFKFRVTLFEQADKLGGHAFTQTVQVPKHTIINKPPHTISHFDPINSNSSVQPLSSAADLTEKAGVDVDTGFMVFNRVTYPNLISWFDRHGVEIEKSDMSFSVSMQKINTNEEELEWSSNGINSIYAQKSNIFNKQFNYMVYSEMARFHREAEQYLIDIKTAEINDNTVINQLITLEQWTQESNPKYSNYFLYSYLFPICSCIWSVPIELVLKFPVKFLFEFMSNHCLLQLFNRPQWCTVSNRTQKGYVKKISAKFMNSVQLNCKIVSIWPNDTTNKITIKYNENNNDNIVKSKIFDRIIMCSHAPESLQLIQNGRNEYMNNSSIDNLNINNSNNIIDWYKSINSLLSKFQTNNNIIYLHSDPKLMPKRKPVWSAWNFRNTNSSSSSSTTSTNNNFTCTYWLNPLQNLNTTVPIMVTLNPSNNEIPNPNLTYNKWDMRHPIPSIAGYASIISGEFNKLQGANGVYFAGAWTGSGFHEAGFVSGLNAANALIQHLKQTNNNTNTNSNNSTSTNNNNQLSLILSTVNLTPILPRIPSFSNRTGMFSLTNICRQLSLNYLNKFIKIGYLEIRESGGTIEKIGIKPKYFQYNQNESYLIKNNSNNNEGYACVIEVFNPEFYNKLVSNSNNHNNNLDLLQSYVQGDFICSNLLSLLCLIKQNQNYIATNNSNNSKGSFLSKFIPLTNKIASNILYFKSYYNNKDIQFNILDYYNDNTQYYKSFLDKSLTFSCPIFNNNNNNNNNINLDNSSLELGQINKLTQIINLCNIKSGSNILEIGCGFGSLSRLLNKLYNNNIYYTGLVSNNKLFQYCQTQSPSSSSNYNYQLGTLYNYYNNHKLLLPKFDCIICCEGFEGINDNNLGEFYSICDKLLNPNGVLIMQIITNNINNSTNNKNNTNVKPCNNYNGVMSKIFNLQLLPYLQRLSDSCISKKNNNSLQLQLCENISNHYTYAFTIWKQNFIENNKNLTDHNGFIHEMEYCFTQMCSAFLMNHLAVFQIKYIKT